MERSLELPHGLRTMRGGFFRLLAVVKAAQLSPLASARFSASTSYPGCVLEEQGNLMRCPRAVAGVRAGPTGLLCLKSYLPHIHSIDISVLRGPLECTLEPQ